VFHEVEGSACVESSDGMAKGGDVLFFNTVYYHVTKCCADVAKDMISIGGEAM